MPKVDMDQATGTVVEWLKKDGDTVRQGEPILVIETDKVAIEVEAPASGILRGIRGEKGEVIPIATVIGFILEPGEALPAGAAPASAPAAAAPPAPSAASAAPASVGATPVARNMAASAGIDLGNISGSGPRGKVTKEDVQAALSGTPAPVSNGKPYATPAARRTAREQGVDLATVRGSGPKGRIQAADVQAAAAALAARPSITPPAPLAAEGVSTPEAEIVPLQGMRRTIAERMTASYQQAPHIFFTSRVDMTRFNEAREQMNARSEATGGPRISATALIVKTTAMILARHPWLNASLRGDDIYLWRDVNIGVAVALESGLIVPVVRNADRKGIAQIAAEVNDVAVRAREGRLVPSDVSGGTFTVSNLGPFGVEQFSAIINPPQAAILAVGATQMEAVPDASGQIAARPIMRMTLSADHRIVDGAVAAYFIADLKAALEAPALLLY
jgi:pyruvate dehydrogenase E2 component (dihydrolipoamide acetyltransferase)